MRIKSMVIEKMDDAGTGLARIAKLSAIDSDGDTYAPGAFSWKEGGGQWVQMIPAHDRRAMPFGKAWLYERDDHAFADLNLNLDTQAGKEWHAALKFDLAKGLPVQEWSYGFQVVDFAIEQRSGERVRVLKRLDCDEISPVLRGAGVGTGTLAIKSATLKGVRFDALIGELGELADAVKADPAMLSATGLKQLGEIYAALGVALSPDDQDAAIKSAEQLLAQAHAGLMLRTARRHLPA